MEYEKFVIYCRGFAMNWSSLWEPGVDVYVRNLFSVPAVLPFCDMPVF